MQIVLHIGAEKTGTSSIQRFFKVNRELLAGQSILYSKVAGAENHMALAAAAQDDEKFDDLRAIYELDTPARLSEFRTEFSRQLADEARESGCSKLVLSGEHCSSRLVSIAEVDRLAGILRPLSGDIVVVVYIRRQDEFLCSTYSTDIKSGFTGAMRIPSAELRHARYNYDELLRRWSSVFGRGNIICRLYAPDRLKGGDIVEDFAEIVGVTPGDDLFRPRRINESLDVTALEFLRVFNKSVPRIKDSRLNAMRGNIVELLQKVSAGPAPSLPDHLLREFMEYFRSSNAQVAREYFGGISPTGDPLFGEAGPSRNRQEMKPIDVETAVTLAARLWSEKQQQVLDQAERIQKLERSLGKQRR